ncbi:ABC transporter ATP-binding protein [Enterococcus faecalis]|uniref:ABC transporter ATP-binding protein n=1 Tax=Enterococcus faecalis TaxID=1351 RepID=UPI002DBBE596|nr:ABC transporter ATP-binding protein [Enterococcus faecalis]MEB7954578.1 ABC transporter ATP-binding protein [Enterococcus faecalis]MEB7964709.1 ABC transporter ATP-binding protein [Enterococcus faecalis]
MVISVNHLDVRYKDKHAVKGVSFDVHKGEIFGMIGTNGAGKTTIIECIEGLRTKYKGSIDVLGINPKHSRTELFKRIGVQLQETSYQDKIKVWEIGKLFESFYKTPANFDELLSDFDLLEKKNSYIGKLSGGQRQKLSIILALMSNPDIVFLDEITTGLDPKSRRDIWEKVKKLKSSGITVYMTTHFMEEAEYLCDRVAIVRQGEIVALDTLQNLIKGANISDKITFETQSQLSIDDISSWEGVESCEVSDNKYCIKCVVDIVLGKLSSYTTKNGIIITNIDVKHPTLEDVFFKYTGEVLTNETSSIPTENHGKKGGKKK